MAELVLGVMSLAALLYALFGGADFGAGLLDALLRGRVRERVDVAIAPVWEANHVWLILVVVLSFVGFPRAYATVSTLLHIPLSGMLLGIVARGSAFTFRHYDPAASSAQPLARGYDAAFRAGSVLTPVCIGFVLSALAGGKLTHDTSLGFYRVYVAPWNDAFGWATALFVTALFAFEGAALLAAEHPRDAGEPLPYLRLARRLHGLVLASGLLVGLCAHLSGAPWLDALWAKPLAWGSLAAALALSPVIALAFQRGRVLALRLALGAQLAGFVVGFFAGQFPVLVYVAGADVRFPEDAAPPAVLSGLCWAVVVGLVLILPALFYLVRTYKQPGATH